MKKCLHQIIRPKRRNVEKHNGVGECCDCQPDESNKNCNDYYPISDFQNFEVEKNGEGKG